jgi:hypothetical protein
MKLGSVRDTFTSTAIEITSVAMTSITTVSNPKAQCPLDKVNRTFKVTRINTL